MNFAKCGIMQIVVSNDKKCCFFVACNAFQSFGCVKPSMGRWKINEKRGDTTGISPCLNKVRLKGLEPSRRETPDPKSGASANSATSASGYKGNVFSPNNQKFKSKMLNGRKTYQLPTLRLLLGVRLLWRRRYSVFLGFERRLAISPMKRPRHNTTRPMMIYSAVSPRPRSKMSPPERLEEMPIRMPPNNEVRAIDE